MRAPEILNITKIMLSVRIGSRSQEFLQSAFIVYTVFVQLSVESIFLNC